MDRYTELYQKIKTLTEEELTELLNLADEMANSSRPTQIEVSSESITSANEILRLIVNNDELLKIVAAFCADGSADDVSNLIEYLFGPRIADFLTGDSENEFLRKIYSLYENAINDNGYRVIGGYNGKVTLSRLEWELKWYGKEVNGPQNGIEFSEKKLLNLRKKFSNK
jgi:hypothetical protein